jgi:hypothetical protein
MSKAVVKKSTPPTAEPKTPLTVLEKLHKLDEDRTKLEETRKSLLDTARTELLAQGQAVIAGLKSLGFVYILSEPAKKSHHKPVKGLGIVRERATPEGKVCPVCNYATSPVHDARTHRHMKEKKPFTEAELQEKNLVRL